MNVFPGTFSMYTAGVNTLPLPLVLPAHALDGARPDGGSHLDAGRLLVVVLLRLILQPDWALTPPGC